MEYVLFWPLEKDQKKWSIVGIACAIISPSHQNKFAKNIMKNKPITALVDQSVSASQLTSKKKSCIYS